MPIGKKSDKIRVPHIDKPLYKHFIRGYFDDDGFVVKSKKRIGFCGNIHFLKSIKQIFIDFGLATKRDGYLRIYSNSYYGELNYSKIVASKIMDWMYNDASIYLKRKYNDFYQCHSGFKTS